MINRTDESQALINEEETLPKIKTTRNQPVTSRPRPTELGLTAPNQTAKNYVLDTNVLLHDPAALERFKENHLCIPVDVLSELDKFKSEQTERGANARRVHRRLTEMFSCTQKVTRGVDTAEGGTIRLVIYDPEACPKNSSQLDSFHRIFPDRERVDHRIADAAVFLVDRYRHDIASIITDTVERWDPAETTEKIELMVGRDLQYIRLNGTVVGALAGLAIFTIAHALIPGV